MHGTFAQSGIERPAAIVSNVSAIFTAASPTAKRRT